jgi:class 3 adenylate cyclase
MRGLLNKTVVVGEGETALLFLGGRLDQTLSPGRHSIGNILSSRTRDASVVLFQTSDIPLDVTISRLLSSDPLPLSLEFRLVLKVYDPMRFMTNLASGADSYAAADMASVLFGPLQAGCQSFIASRSIHQLGGPRMVGNGQGGKRNEGDDSISSDLVLSLASQLDQVASRWGIRLISTQAVSIRCEAWDDITQTRTNYYVAAAEGQAELEGRKRLFDVFQESEIQTLAEETLSVVGVEQRLSLWERMRQALLAKSKGEVQSQTELENLLREADSDRLLKENEMQQLVRTMAEGKEDHEKSRAFLLRRIEAEGEYELQKLDLGHRFGLSQDRLSFEVASARQEMEGHWELELLRVEADIEQDRRLNEFRRQQESLDQEVGNRSMVDEAQRDAAIADFERDTDERDLTMLINVNSRRKEANRRDELERMRAQLEAERERQEMQLQASERAVELKLKESRASHSLELERIDALSQAGIETLIAVSGPDQAQMLAQLARTRALATCSPQQILAMQAESSPQVADALREILTATAADGQLEQYERLVAELKENAQTSREDHRQNMATLQEMFNKALDSVKDVSVAFSASAGVANGSTIPQQPDLRSHAAPDGTITLMFTDIEGSTAMNQRLGDEAAQAILREHNKIFRREVENHQGYEVKSMGDGFMLAFSNGRKALDCAVAVQQSLSSYNTLHTAEPLRVRMGLHTGDAIKEGDDFFGRNVILAARISAKANGGQILVSSLFKEMTESGDSVKYGEVQEMELKGLAELARVYLVLWERQA